ncbi:unnamed protein product, partial [Rotaria magnacalcarata]
MLTSSWNWLAYWGVSILRDEFRLKIKAKSYFPK